MEHYDIAWTDLNALLRDKEATQGLGHAIDHLEHNQCQTGFIKDTLFGVERYVFHHPDDPSRVFRVQFNAERMARFNHAGSMAPPEGVEPAHGGCFLCRDNIRWQHQGSELGYELSVNNKAYHAWMNPFPLMPSHVVVASVTHETQNWEYGPGGGVQVQHLVDDLVTLAARMPGYIGYYNGTDAGASIAGHLHYQFFKRPQYPADFPLEIWLQGRHPDHDAPAEAADYPLPVVKWEGVALSTAAASWIDDWAHRNAERIYRLTANIIVTAAADKTVTLYFVPRDRGKPRSKGMSGLIGGLEVLGEVVFSSTEERILIDSGAVDYFTIENMLRSVRTPLFLDRP